MEESKRFIQIAVALIYKSTIIIDVIDEKSKAQNGWGTSPTPII